MSLIQSGYTGLMLASSRGHTAIVKVLAEAKADPNITDKVKLHYTHYCIVYELIKTMHVIHRMVFAASRGSTNIVNILVDHGADVHIRNKVYK